MIADKSRKSFYLSKRYYVRLSTAKRFCPKFDLDNRGKKCYNYCVCKPSWKNTSPRSAAQRSKMGRQINYYMERESFLQVAQLALDCGCEIIKENLSVRPTTVIRTRDIAAITPNDWMFWFYVPEAGQLATNTYEYGERLDRSFSESGNALIEAGVSLIHEEEKTISRNRLYVQSGYYDASGVWVPRPKCVDAVYNKLARCVKKLTVYDGFFYVTEYCRKLFNEGYNKR